MISVIIPTYNCAKYITEAIDSVLAQTYSDKEIIIIDDGSVDDTAKILKQFVNGDKIRAYFQKNMGPAAARNRGIKESRGNYIAFLDADDLWINDKLEKSIHFLKENSFDWICTSMLKIKENGERFIKRIPNESFVLNLQTKEIKQLSKGIFFFSSIAVHTPTIVTKKECFGKVGLFDESFLIYEDTDLWLRFEEAGLKGGYLDEPLTIYRYNERSLTKGGKIDGLKQAAMVARKHVKILGLQNKAIKKSYSNFLWQVAELYWKNKKPLRMFKYIVMSLYFNPGNLKRILKKVTLQNNDSLWKK